MDNLLASFWKVHPVIHKDNKGHQERYINVMIDFKTSIKEIKFKETMFGLI